MQPEAAAGTVAVAEDRVSVDSWVEMVVAVAAWEVSERDSLGTSAVEGLLVPYWV